MKRKNSKILNALCIVLLMMTGCEQPVNPKAEPPHVHTFSTDWATDATSHWHTATCEHTTEVSGKVDHQFPETWTLVTAATEEADGLEERFCDICNYRATQVIPQLNHNHDIAKVWSTDSTKHWHAASCGRAEHNEDVGEHTEDSGTVTTAPGCFTKGEKTFKCSVCNEVLKTEEIAAVGWCESPVDAETGNAATANSKYIYFGVFPKTVLSSTASISVDETDKVTMGANTYYKGNDGNYYAKVLETCSGSTVIKYSDGSTVKQSSANSYRYFKVEPIKWKVLSKNYNGKCLLLAEDILTAHVPYYVSSSNRTIGTTEVYTNNYKYSTIRAYLNGAYESDDTQTKTYDGSGFLQTAFTSSAQTLISKTNVDNSKETTGYSESTYATDYVCENTEDKIFLLSENDVSNSVYGFEAYNKCGKGSTRIRVTTDYAKANCAYQSTTDGDGGSWWLRSPYCDNSNYARYVSSDGSAYYYTLVIFTSYGVVPALSISF